MHVQVGQVKLEAEVACLDISPLNPDASASALAAVGDWRQQLHVLATPGLTPLTEVRSVSALTELLPVAFILAAHVPLLEFTIIFSRSIY